MAIKITQWSPDTCGCVLQYSWNTDDPEATRTHTHHKTIKLCVDHLKFGLVGPAHLEHISKENRHKNLAVDTVSKTLGIEPHEVAFKHDGDRVLTLHVPKVTHPEHLETVRAKVKQEHGTVHVEATL